MISVKIRNTSRMDVFLIYCISAIFFLYVRQI
nr:MAG TPA: hypothetical protein [Caudoviricetes sp.]